MLLTIDIGNTAVTMGVFRDGLAAETDTNGTNPVDRLVTTRRLATDSGRLADEYGIMLKNLLEFRGITPSDITSACICSVVPPLTRTVTRMARDAFGVDALVVDAANAGLRVRYRPPEDVGADRLVNSLAALDRYGKSGRGIVVVDFGTATTFDVISAAGDYVGGVICPGVEVSADALFERAARLPRVDVRHPGQAIGTSTVASMQSGLYFGYVAMVEGLLTRLRAELAGDGPAVSVATGGLAAAIAAETEAIDRVDHDLTLHGLRLAWLRNRGPVETGPSRRPRSRRAQHGRRRNRGPVE